MGEDQAGSEHGGGWAECVERDEGGESNDRKRGVGYASGPREAGSVRETEEVLVGFRMRKFFQGEARHRVKGESVSWEESWEAAEYRREARRGYVAATRGLRKGSIGTGTLGVKR